MAETRGDGGRRTRDGREGWERAAAATGAVFVILALIGFLLDPSPPGPDSSNDEVLSHFSDNETNLRWQALFFAAGGVALLWFAGTLASALRRRLDRLAGRSDDGDRRLGWLGDGGRRWPAIIVASAGTAVATYLGGTAAYTALAARAGEEIDASAGRALFELGGALITFTTFPALAFIGAASLAVARTRWLPDWLAWLGAAVVAVLAINGIGAVVADSDTFGPSGAFGIIAFLSFLLWILVASALLTMQRDDDRSRGAEGTTRAA